MKYSVEFATSCYEKDWEFLLKTNRLQNMIAACNYPFEKVILYLNNIKNYKEAISYAEKHKEDGIITDYIIIKEHAEKVLEHFKIKNPNKSYYFLIQGLTMVYFSECKYLLHFTCDSILINNEPWINAAIEKMKNNDRIIVANALNINDEKLIMRESFDHDEEFYASYGFSDQCALLKTSYYKKPIYNEETDLSLFYPERSRGSFEERVYRYMRNHKCYRITHKRAKYRHKNFPKNKFKKWISLYTSINNKKYGLKD